MTLFQPVGDRARWELVYDLLSPLDIGDVVTYEALGEALDETDRAKMRPALYRAAQRWGDEQRRALRPVRNTGYVVASIDEQEQLVRGQHRKSRRALSRSHRLAHNADRSLMDDEQRKRFDALESTVARQQDMIRRLDTRTSRVEEALSQSVTRQEVTEERLQALERRLAAYKA